LKNISNEVGDVALMRDQLKIEISNNDHVLEKLLHARTKQRMKNKIFTVLKNNRQCTKFQKHTGSKVESKIRGNFLKKVFFAWRIEAHKEYKQKQIELEPTYYQERKEEVITEWDDLIEGLRGYVEQLQQEVKIEVNAKAELAKIYEVAMNGSVKKFVDSNHFVNTQVNEYRQTVGFDDTFGRAGKTEAMNQTNAMQSKMHITLVSDFIEQRDPEENKS